MKLHNTASYLHILTQSFLHIDLIVSRSLRMIICQLLLHQYKHNVIQLRNLLKFLLKICVFVSKSLPLLILSSSHQKSLESFFASSDCFHLLFIYTDTPLQIIYLFLDVTHLLNRCTYHIDTFQLKI